MVDRRRFIRLIGATCLGASAAGCQGDSGDDSTPTDDASDGTAPTSTPAETPTDASATATPGDDSGTGDGDGSGTDTPEPYSTELIRITAGGDDLGPRREQGHFYYESRDGDFDVAVHAMALEGTTGWEKAGIMVRDSLDPTAAHLMVRRNPDGEGVYDASPASIQWRAETGGVNSAQRGIMAEWLRLQREGDTFRIYGSMTGADWEQFGEFTTDDVALGPETVVGLAATGMEEYDAPTVTATFKDLSGLSPEDNTDLGEPDHAGEVAVRDDLPVVSTAEPGRAPTELELAGNVFLPEGVETADCHFEYRRNDSDEWRTTDRQTVSSSQTVTATVDADTRRIYQLRARAEFSEASEVEGADLGRGATAFRSTPSPASGDGGEDDGDAGDGDDEPASLSPGVAEFGPGDGFADPAPWLDDDTPVVTITEPTVEELDRALKTPHERLVVFETSGVIDLGAEEWSIMRDRCYVAGQTAPSPGITMIRGSFQVAADDCVVQHVRVRAGIAGQEDGWAPTGLHTQDGSENNVIDHCTVTWAIDENLTVGGRSSDTTLTNNIAAEGLADATHPKGIHSYGSLIKDDAQRVAMMGNVWAHNVGRNPRLKTGTTSAVVNNVMYHFDEATNLDSDSIASVVGNAYLRVDEGDANIEGGRAYVDGNLSDPETPMTNGVESLDFNRIWPGSLEALSADAALEHGLGNAGARPADRTDHDRRLIEQVRERSGDRIDAESEVGGYPDLPANAHDVSVPDSGTREWLREQSRRVEDGA